jgi:hypothetical protein
MQLLTASRQRADKRVDYGVTLISDEHPAAFLDLALNLGALIDQPGGKLDGRAIGVGKPWGRRDDAANEVDAIGAEVGRRVEGKFRKGDHIADGGKVTLSGVA